MRTSTTTALLRTLSTALLVAGLTTVGTPAVDAATSCDPKNDAHWTSVKSYTDVANFQPATRGTSSGLKVADKTRYAERVKTVVDETVTAVPYGTEILLKVVGMADAAGSATSNKRLAEARAKTVYSAVKRALDPTDVGRIHDNLLGVVSESTGEAARNASVTVLRCKTTPAAPKPAYDKTSTSGSAVCDARTMTTTTLLTESWLFNPAKPSYRDGLKPQDADVFASRVVYTAGIVAGKATSPGGVYIEVTGYSTATGSSRTNDRLAADRAKAAVSAIKKALAQQGGGAVATRVRTVGSRVRATAPRVDVTVSHCP